MRQVSGAINNPQFRRMVGGGGQDFDDQLAIREGYNPGSLTGWTGTASYSYEGLSVELGDYGPRQFGAFGTPSALNGSINIPSTATIANHGSGISGYVKNASTTTGGVAIYGEANRQANSALVWGMNTRTQDNGFGGLNVWGYEMDMNIDNVGTTAVGFDAVGASTVTPTVSVAYQVQAIGIFASPKKSWQFGFRSRDAAALIGIELGAQTEGNSAPSQTLVFNYRNGAGTPTAGLTAQVDGAGVAILTGNVKVAGNIGFYSTAPIAKPTVTGSRGANAALASALTALANLGLITDSST